MVCDQLVPEHLHPDPLAVSRWDRTAGLFQPSSASNLVHRAAQPPHLGGYPPTPLRHLRPQSIFYGNPYTTGPGATVRLSGTWGLEDAA